MPKFTVTVTFQSETFTFDTDDYEKEALKDVDVTDLDQMKDFIQSQFEEDPATFTDFPQVEDLKIEAKK